MAFSSSSASFAENLGTEVVTIFVGPERKHYVVHKKLLTSQSEYFDKALNGRFKEAEENCIHLEEDVPAAVALLIGWLYRGVIPGTEKPLSPFIRSNYPTSMEPVPISDTGTRIVPFHATLILDQNRDQIFSAHQDAFQHICFQNTYKTFSPEELRLADYKDGRRYQGSHATYPAPFGNLFPATNQQPAPPHNPQSQPATTPQAPAGNPLPPQNPGQGSAPPLAPQATTANPPPNPAQGSAPQSLFANTQNPIQNLNHPSLFQGSGVFGNLAIPIPSSSMFANLSQNPTQNSTTQSLFGNLSQNPSPNSAAQPLFSNVPYHSQTSTPPPSVFSTNPPANAFSSFFTSIKSPRNSSEPTSDFGKTSRISHPKSPAVYIPGIPRCLPINDQIESENALQLSLVHLCILAETICWEELFNAAVEAYVRGEMNLHRAILIEHVDLIYERTHSESPLRTFVIDSISQMDPDQDHLAYLPLARKYDEFLEDVFHKLSKLGKKSGGLASGWDSFNESLSRYHMPSMDENSKPLSGGVFAKQRDVDTQSYRDAHVSSDEDSEKGS
ncbi:hypothetical protein B7494_g1793 [Chlorociboria aeruginascens]|nr:hypothetical protein B7494_g1793 [Chlorociboria aeruginascens]